MARFDQSTHQSIRGSIGAALLTASVTLFAGCAHHNGPPPLYAWGEFPRLQYDTLLGSGIAPSEQAGLMEAQASEARTAGAALPPGFRAHLGMLKLATGDADQARQLWQAEKVAFPESAPYMDQLLKRLDAPIAPLGPLVPLAPLNKDKPA